MSDKPLNELTARLSVKVSQLFDPDFLADLNNICELARNNQLNKNKTDPVLKRLEQEWKTMDRFSKRELGPGDVKK